MGFEKLGVFSARVAPIKEFFAPGHRACQGCGEALAVKLVHKALGRNTIVACATGCMEIISSSYPDSAWDIPWIHVAFENAAAVISGIEAGYKALMKKGKYPEREINFVAMAGDGGTADIGIQALSGALERGHKIIYICYDNEAYMNTGIQRSSSTPYGAKTTTSPPGKKSIGQSTWKKPLPLIAASHKIPYVATANPSFPFDLMEKIEKAKKVKGPSYIHIFSVCDTGWQTPSNMTVHIGRLATFTGVFPIYEIFDGKKYVINIKPEKLLPVEKYLELQGRFRHLFKKDKKGVIEEIQKRVTEEWEWLLYMEKVTENL